MAELVYYSLPPVPLPQTGTHLEPSEYNTKMSQPNTVIIDVRNNYESQIGRFKPPSGGAVLLDPEMRRSTEFKDWVNSDSTKSMIKGKQVLMYCTGGIRCERASSYLKSQAEEGGLDLKGVYQLQGGIHNYLEQFKDGGLWEGKNYVFDKRFGHAGDETPSSAPLGKCCICQIPWERYRGKRRCPTCGVPSLICPSCLENEKKEKGKGKGVRGRCPLCVRDGIFNKSQLKGLGGYLEKNKKNSEDWGKSSATSPNDLYSEVKKKNGKRSHADPESNASSLKKQRYSKSASSSSSSSSSSTVCNPTTRVYIGNLPIDYTSEDIKSCIPHVKFYQPIRDKPFLFAEIDTIDNATKLVNHGATVKGRSAVVRFKEVDEKFRWPSPDSIWLS